MDPKMRSVAPKVATNCFNPDCVCMVSFSISSHNLRASRILQSGSGRKRNGMEDEDKDVINLVEMVVF